MKVVIGKIKPLLAAFLFVFALSAGSAGFVYATNDNSNDNGPTGNNGTLKVHEIGTPSGTESNDPKVCAFNFEGFGFDSSQSGYINIDGQGQTSTNYDNQFPFGPTDGTGYAISQDFNDGGSTFNIADGQYKATLYGKDTGGKIDLGDTKAKSKVFKVDCSANQVGPAAVTFNDVCGTGSDTYNVPATTGVNYQIGGNTVAASTYAGSGSVTVSAVAQVGFNLTGTTSWSHTFTNVACEVPLTPVQPAAVTFNDVCGTDKDTYTIPTTAGIDYQVNGQTVSAGDHTGSGAVTVTAVAQSGFTLTGTATWSDTFTNNPCETPQTEAATAAVTFVDFCGTANDTYTVPSTTGVDYQINGQTVAADTYPGAGAVTVTAVAQSGFTLSGDTSWSHTFTNTFCGDVLGDSVTVIKPGDPDPEFTDATCSTGASYTVVAKEGVIYKDGDGNVVAPGTYPATNGTTVTITAYPASDAFEFSRDVQTVWTHTFSFPSCGQVLGASTSVNGDGQVLGASTLADTGISPIPSIILATVLVSAGIFVHGKQKRSTPKRIEVTLL